MSEDLFAVEDTSNTVTIDENVDYIEKLVGEDKKFKDVAALARGKYEADVTIETFKSQLDELRKELKQKQSLEEILTELRKGKGDTPDGGTQAAAPVVEPNNDSDLESKLEKILAERESKRAQETNAQKVQRVLTDQFGADAKAAINKKATELGMSLDELKRLSTTSPGAFFALMGVSEDPRVPVSPVVPRTQVNSFSQDPGAPVKNAKYFERMKQTNPKEYFSAKTTTDMIKARAALGDKFYS